MAFPLATSSITLSTSWEPPVPFGTCERAPEIIELPEFEETFNDLGGTKKAFDFTYQGTDAIVTGVLTRYRESVYRRLTEQPRFTTLGIRSDDAGDVGTFMGFENKAPQLYLEYLYGGGGPFAGAGPFAHPAHVSGSLPAGLRFVAAMWRGPTRHTVGSGTKKIGMVWLCMRKYVSGNMFVADENLSAISGLAWEVAP